MRNRSLVGFLVVIALAFLWRFAGLTHDSLWLDEGYQSMIGASGQRLPDFFSVPERPFVFKFNAPASAEQMLRNFRTVDPLTPPLYQLVLNRWMGAFGGGDFSARSLSALLSVCSVGAVFGLALALFGSRCAFFASLVMAFSPFDIFYGQEVRMYSLEELSATLSVGALLLFLWGNYPRRLRWLLLGLHAVGAWMLINSHYTGLFCFAFEILLGIAVALGRRSFKESGELFASWVLVLLLWLPWLPLFFKAAALRKASFYVIRTATWWWPVVALFLRIPENWLVFLAGKQVVWQAVPLYLTSAALLVLLPARLLASQAVARWFHPLTRRASWDIAHLPRPQAPSAAVIAWALLPALMLWAMDVLEGHRVIEMSRYVMATAPAIFIITGLGLSGWRYSFRLPAVLLIAHLGFCAVNNVAHATMGHQREPWREMAALVESMVPRSDLVLVSQYYDIVCLDRYLVVPYRQVGVSGITTSGQLNGILNGVSEFALVTAQEGDRVKASIPTEYAQVYEKDLGHSLHLLLYQRR